MTTRRTVLKALGVGAAVPVLARSQEQPARRSTWEMIVGGETRPATMKPDWRTWDPTTITAAWIGHATILLNFFGTWILTDPVFSNRIGISVAGLTTLGPKRLVDPALTIEELPRIDLLLLSHGHMDHLDLPSIGKMRNDVPTIIAKNTLDILNGTGLTAVSELDWGDTTTAAGITVEALRVKHFGWRFPWEEDRSRGYWNGRSFNAYLLTKNGRHIVFGGDTAKQEYFTVVGLRGIDVDLAMMPIGAYDPWVENHCNPEEAIAMADDLNAKVILPMHWGTFIQSNEPTMEPIERFTKALAAHPQRVALTRHGETWTQQPRVTSSGTAPVG